MIMKVIFLYYLYVPYKILLTFQDPIINNLSSKLQDSIIIMSQEIKEQKEFEVFVFEKMTSRKRQKLKFAETCFCYGSEIYLYIHPTLGTFYALNPILPLQPVYCNELLTFPLIANHSKDLIALREWVFRGAKEEKIDIESVIKSKIDAKFIENYK